MSQQFTRGGVLTLVLLLAGPDTRAAPGQSAAPGDAGVPLGRALSGIALATYVLVTAADGYQVVFSLGEADPALANSRLLIAGAANGSALPDTRGPLRLVAPHDARPMRSVRMLRRVDVVQMRQ